MNKPLIQINNVVREMTDEEFSELSERAALLQLTAYKEQRALEYPPMQDYLDGIVKNDKAQIQAYIDACLAVKAKYPKPE